jgi:diguanylate cyclase (GGDEF)-like protein
MSHNAVPRYRGEAVRGPDRRSSIAGKRAFIGHFFTTGVAFGHLLVLIFIICLRPMIPLEHQQADTLRAALDEIDLGTVLLDGDLHVQFVNRAFLRIYRLAEKSVVAGLAFEHLMRLVVGKRRVLEPVEFDAYIRMRANEIRAGNEEARDIRMDDGQVIRVNCKTLPDGGRMLVYANVTDLVEQTERLKELATVDGMTGLFNRRHFLSLAEMEWSRHRRHGRPISILMLDIDRFKSINDRFGHHAGDHVIVTIAELCRHEKRNSDVVARFGGEEFLLLLPETQLTQARQFAERLRRAVEVCDLSTAAHVIRATVSIGVAEATSTMETIFHLIKAADHALYTAKNAGRNCVFAA